MRTCQSCKQKWSWWETVKAGFTLDIAMKCNHCGSKQYLTKKTRKRIFWYTLPVYFIVPVCISFNIPFGWGLLIAVAYGAVIISIGSFFIELTNEEQLPWFPFTK